MSEIAVSVIIPFFEHVDWLEEAVESVCRQSFQKEVEIIVVNDGSKEDVADFLSKYGDKIIYIDKENGGPATARNVGIERAKGKYIAFLDSDDIWLPQKLEIQFERMEKSDCQWSYCAYKTFGMGGSSVCHITAGKSDEIQRYSRPTIATPSVMVRRRLLVENPDYRFNNAMRYGQDSYMWLKINADNSILAIHECLVKVRVRGGNAAKRARVQLQARGLLWQYRKREKEELIDKFKVTVLFRIASNLCIAGNAVVSLAARLRLSERILEFIAKLLFVLPWALFKLDRKITS